MKPDFECAATASFLKSGSVLVGASHCAAVIAGLAILLGDGTARWCCAASWVCWPMACYLGVRVAFDASLFAKMDEPSGAALDEVLVRWGMKKQVTDRPIAERSLGARRLWKQLAMAVGVQVALLAIGLAMQVAI
jgi:hypothetical protein